MIAEHMALYRQVVPANSNASATSGSTTNAEDDPTDAARALA